MLVWLSVHWFNFLFFFFIATSVRELWSLFNFWLKFEGKIFLAAVISVLTGQKSFDSAQTSQQNKLPLLGPHSSFVIYFYDFGSAHSLVAPSILVYPSVSPFHKVYFLLATLPSFSLQPPSHSSLCYALCHCNRKHFSLTLVNTKRLKSNTSTQHKCLMLGIRCKYYKLYQDAVVSNRLSLRS